MKNILTILICLLSLQIWAQETSTKETQFEFPHPEQNFPAKKGLFQDNVGLFNATEQVKIATKLNDYQSQTKHAIYFVVVDKIQPYDNMLDYTNDLSKYWQLDPTQQDFIIMVISLDMADIRINTTEQNLDTLSVEFLTNVIQETMIPAFNEGLMFDGVDKALDRIMATW